MTDSRENQEGRRRSERIAEKKIMEDLGVNNSLINKLPNDCLKHIFSFLPILERLHAEKVCKRWRIIGERGWSDIKTLTINREYSDNTVHLMLKRCGRFLRELKIYDSPEHPHSLSMIMKFCKLDQLEDIEIHSRVGMKNDECFIRNLREIFEKTRKITAVTIKEDEIRNSIDCLNVLNPESLQKLCLTERMDNWLDDGERGSINPDKFPNLKKLDLGGIKIFGNKTKREEMSLKGLEKLELSNCDIPQSFVERIATFSNLQELTLHQTYFDLHDEHIHDITRHCTKLKDVSILDCFSLTTDCFRYLGGMQSLEILKLSEFENIRSRDFMHLANVKNLDVSFDSDTHSGDAVIGLIQNSLNLEKIKLLFCFDIDLAFVNNIRKIFHRGQRKKHLNLTIVCYQQRRPIWDIKMIPDHPLLNVFYEST